MGATAGIALHPLNSGMVTFRSSILKKSMVESTYNAVKHVFSYPKFNKKTIRIKKIQKVSALLM